MRVRPVSLNGWSGYSVSDEGVVYGRRGLPLTPHVTLDGYAYVEASPVRRGGLRVRRFREYVHRLVAFEFCARSVGMDQVHHLNGRTLDNRAVNLQWCSQDDNLAARDFASPVRGWL